MRVVLAIAFAIGLTSCKRIDRAAPIQSSTSASAFRFSPRPNRASEIHWQGFSQAVFDRARAEKRPVLLSLAAVWCHWCHVLDETTLSDERVIERVNRDFIPVRVDADQRPDVEQRYILGGWPTVAFLDADGEILDGGTYVPPDSFVAMADGALAIFRGAAPRKRMSNAFDPTAPGALDNVVEGVVRAIEKAADLDNGGFGGAPKFPHGEAVALLLEVGEKELAKQALDAMLKIEDPVEGGFYRYATRADWTVPHYEKMLYGQADLLIAYARGARVLGDARYRRAALGIVSYVRATLTALDGTFYASQDADERYALADAAARRGMTAPYVDRTLLVDRNGRMIDALVSASTDLADSSMLETAARAASVIATLRDDHGAFFHARRPNERPELPGLLADQAWAALAITEVARTRRQAAPPIALAAIAVAAATLADPRGGFFDQPAGAAPGLLRRRDKVLDANVAMARAQLALGGTAAAEKTLSAVAGSYPLFGTEAAPYARAVAALQLQLK